jgi:hypothetical protein
MTDERIFERRLAHLRVQVAELSAGGARPAAPEEVA